MFFKIVRTDPYAKGSSKEEEKRRLRQEYPDVFDHIKALHSDTGRQEILKRLEKETLYVSIDIPRVQRDFRGGDHYTIVMCHEDGFTFFRELVKTCDLEYITTVLSADLPVEDNFLLRISYLINEFPHVESVMSFLIEHRIYSQNVLKSTLANVCCNYPNKLELLNSLIFLIKDINDFNEEDPIMQMVETGTLDSEVIGVLLKAGLDMDREVNLADRKVKRVDLITNGTNPAVMRDICDLLI